MPRSCSICLHSERDDIDVALAGGEAVVRVAAKFSVSSDAVSRHFANHVRPGTVRAQAAAVGKLAREVDHALDLTAEVRKRLDRADKLVGISEDLIGRAAQESDWRTAIAGVSTATRAVGETRQCLELLAELEGRIDRHAQINVVVSPEWQTLVSALREILAPHPSILAQVSSALISLEAPRVRAA